MKTIGILTSGGDSPGMNPAVRAAVLAAHSAGLTVFGVNRGYAGMMENDFAELSPAYVADIVNRGGTVLYSARSKEFCTEDGMTKAIANCRSRGIEGVVVIGGDGSFRGARDLSERGLPCVGVPGTIDNDIACTDYTIGYDTCLNTIADMVDRIRDTSYSHDRVMFVEVMGRGAGWLALTSAVASGATAVLLPEIEWDFDRDVLAAIRREQAQGKRYFIIIAAEGCTADGKESVDELAKRTQAATGLESRSVVLGHVQRGGIPTVRDRVIAAQMGTRAVQLLQDGIGNRVVALKAEAVVDYDIFQALKMSKSIDTKLYALVNG
ncbi:MAG: 6-phosphofructokinase [Oscillospiraceae bacterium]|jgi:6-phosphofructokinase 1|nr:6-phosphofructokinase [Oscillospiraceae bacterium]